MMRLLFVIFAALVVVFSHPPRYLPETYVTENTDWFYVWQWTAGLVP